MAKRKSASAASPMSSGCQDQAAALSELRARLDRGGITGSLTESRAGGSVKATIQLNGTPMEVLEQLRVLA